MAAGAWTLAGAALGALFMGLTSRRGPDGQRRAAAVGLLVAALIYVGFGAMAADTRWLAVELSGLAVFGGVVLASGGYGWPLLVAAGWLAHVAWDGLLHLAGPVPAPDWYAALCIGFDLVVAWLLVLTLRDRRGHGAVVA